MSGSITEPSPVFIQNYGDAPLQGIGKAIHECRKRLSEYSINPVLWTNLALLFTTIGQERKAERAMQVALSLAPENRFVVRAASRLFLHHGDPERAHSVLLRTAALRTDPWILAGEVAIADVRERSSQLLKRARTLVESQNWSPFHLSELTGALATMEASNGAIKKAKRLCALSLANPSENAVAQAAWLSRQAGINIQVSTAVKGRQSSEANAWQARADGKWTDALAAANRWQEEQPFSSRPAIFGGYVASTALEDFPEAVRILRQGLLSNRDDATLYNNLAFALAKQGDVEGAREALGQGLTVKATPQQEICLTATRGLVEFRLGRPEQGRALYQRAINMANSDTLRQLRYVATIYHAIEELRIGSRVALTRQKEGLDAAAKLPEELRAIFVEKLRRAGGEGTTVNVQRA